MLLPAFDPYIAAIVWFFINPIQVRGFCEKVNAACCLRYFIVAVRLIATGCITAFIAKQTNVILSAALLTSLSFVTVSSFVWDNCVNTNEKKMADSTDVENQHDKQHNQVNKENNDDSKISKPKSIAAFFADLSKLKDQEYFIMAAGFASIAKFVIIIAFGVFFHFKDIKTNFTEENCNHIYPYRFAGINIAFSLMCYLFSKTACKILRQKSCFAVPLTISVFATPFILYLLVHEDVPYFTDLVIDILPPSLKKMEIEFESKPELFGLS